MYPRTLAGYGRTGQYQLSISKLGLSLLKVDRETLYIKELMLQAFPHEKASLAGYVHLQTDTRLLLCPYLH